MKRSITKIIKDDNWKWQGNLLYNSQFTIILNGFYFENSKSHGTNGFYVWKFQQPLIYVNTNVILTFGRRLVNSDGQEFWSFEEIEKKFSEIFIIESQDLVNNSDIDSFLQKNPIGSSLRIKEAHIYLNSINDFYKSKRLYRTMLEDISKLDDAAEWIKLMINGIDRFLNLSERERKEVLFSNIQETIKNLSLN